MAEEVANISNVETINAILGQVDIQIGSFRLHVTGVATPVVAGVAAYSIYRGIRALGNAELRRAMRDAIVAGTNRILGGLEDGSVVMEILTYGRRAAHQFVEDCLSGKILRSLREKVGERFKDEMKFQFNSVRLIKVSLLDGRENEFRRIKEEVDKSLNDTGFRLEHKKSRFSPTLSKLRTVRNYDVPSYKERDVLNYMKRKIYEPEVKEITEVVVQSVMTYTNGMCNEFGEKRKEKRIMRESDLNNDHDRHRRRATDNFDRVRKPGTSAFIQLWREKLLEVINTTCYKIFRECVLAEVVFEDIIADYRSDVPPDNAFIGLFQDNDDIRRRHRRSVENGNARIRRKLSNQQLIDMVRRSYEKEADKMLEHILNRRWRVAGYVGGSAFVAATGGLAGVAIGGLVLGVAGAAIAGTVAALVYVVMKGGDMIGALVVHVPLSFGDAKLDMNVKEIFNDPQFLDRIRRSL
ncbi:uncharacterized protein LOC143447039 [Clavelina lepadiformis]|uniref:uncharacterized protein LOC143447039 n=1 Tax=Clavelina lepadiformis TaxID=159417 RepID=UPI0040433082